MTSNGDFYSKSTKKSQKSHTNQPISIKQEKKRFLIEIFTQNQQIIAKNLAMLKSSK